MHSAVSEILPDGLLRVPCSPLREREFELCGVPGRFIPHVHAHGMHMHMDTDKERGPDGNDERHKHAFSLLQKGKRKLR